VLDKQVVPTAEQLELLNKNQISAVYTEFAGFTIHNLYEFFMVFVVLCGVASIVLLAISPKLKKMMHQVQ
jgi:POT family proton-dependent oligopeptide transporter